MLDLSCSVKGTIKIGNTCILFSIRHGSATVQLNSDQTIPSVTRLISSAASDSASDRMTFSILVGFIADTVTGVRSRRTASQISFHQNEKTSMYLLFSRQSMAEHGKLQCLYLCPLKLKLNSINRQDIKTKENIQRQRQFAIHPTRY